MNPPPWTTAVLLGLAIVGIVVLSALHDTVPTILTGLVALLAGGHLALSTPTTTTTTTTAAPTARPGPQGVPHL